MTGILGGLRQCGYIIIYFIISEDKCKSITMLFILCGMKTKVSELYANYEEAKWL